MALYRSIALSFLGLFMAFSASAQSVKPVCRVSYPEVTGDKPQSKLWYARGVWWALLPKSDGPSLWERAAEGWKEHPESTAGLKGCVGRCDVWPEGDEVTVVATDREKNICVFRLSYGEGWVGKPKAVLALPEGKEGMMTATIARDGQGLWWVAADVGGSVCVWHSKDAVEWSEPMVLGDGIKKMEDLCLVTRLLGGVGVIWTDQLRDRVVIRERVDGAPVNEWKGETIVEEGNRTADNHLKAALATDGTLWVATKNSVDKVGVPQLVLRVRSAEGKWSCFPYAPRVEGLEPSRPAVFATADPKVVLLGHNVYNRADGEQSFIEFGRVDLRAAEILKGGRQVILPGKGLHSAFVRNITGPKLPFPADAPWIILASDTKGQIYEADLKGVIGNQ